MWKSPFYLNSISKLKMVATIFPRNNPDYENKNFTLIIVCNQQFAVTKLKKLTSYINVQLRSKFCLFLNMYIFFSSPLTANTLSPFFINC